MWLGGMAQRAVVTLAIREQWHGGPLGAVEVLFTKMAAKDLKWLTGQPCVTTAPNSAAASLRLKPM